MRQSQDRRRCGRYPIRGLWLRTMGLGESVIQITLDWKKKGVISHTMHSDDLLTTSFRTRRRRSQSTFLKLAAEMGRGVICRDSVIGTVSQVELLPVVVRVREGRLSTSKPCCGGASRTDSLSADMRLSLLRRQKPEKEGRRERGVDVRDGASMLCGALRPCPRFEDRIPVVSVELARGLNSGTFSFFSFFGISWERHRDAESNNTRMNA